MNNYYDLTYYDGQERFVKMIHEQVKLYYLGSLDDDFLYFSPRGCARTIWNSLILTDDPKIHESEGVDFVNDIEEARALTFDLVTIVIRAENRRRRKFFRQQLLRHRQRR